MKTLQLSLKAEWFEMTKPGIKPEDYRKINEYWFKRFVYDHKRVFKYLTGHVWDYVDNQSREVLIQQICKDPMKCKMIGFKPFDTNTMTLGYPIKTDIARILIFEHGGIEIRTGKQQWGAEPGKLYFVVKHGKRIKPLVDHI